MATATGQGGGRSLILNGHVDVVSPEPVSAWTHDPWGAEIVGDRMYGRGAYDMKSGVGVNLFLARLLNDLDIPLQGDLTIHSVIEEECTGNGALAASLRDTADACLIPESTNSALTTAHPGVIWFRVRIEGRSAHAGGPGRVSTRSSRPCRSSRAARTQRRAEPPVHPLWADSTTRSTSISASSRAATGRAPSPAPASCTAGLVLPGHDGRRCRRRSRARSMPRPTRTTGCGSTPRSSATTVSRPTA